MQSSYLSYMRIRNYCENIDLEVYERIIQIFCYDMFNKSADFREFIDIWEFELHPSSSASENPHFSGKDGVGGVTGDKRTWFYIEDIKTDYTNDIFRRALRKNAIVITHELDHSMLLFKGLSHKVPLRHRDTSNHPTGTMLNFYVAEVHDRASEQRYVTKRYWFWTWKKGAILLTLRVLDIDDLL